MCVLCEMSKQIESLRAIAGDDPIIAAEIRVMENTAACRLALDENMQMAEAVLGNPNAGSGAHERFQCILKHMRILDDGITAMSEEMMRVIANGGPVVTLNTATGKVH